jgi:hypothetical protein
MDDAPRDPAPRAVVAALLGAAGVAANGEDLDALAELYPSIRARVDRLYEVDCADAAPVIVRWEPCERATP